MTKFPWQQARYQDDQSLWEVYRKARGSDVFGSYLGEIRALSESEALSQASQYYEISIRRLAVVLKSKKGDQK